MRTDRSRWAVSALVGMGFFLTGCNAGADGSGAADDPPASVQEGEDGAPARITLSEQAENRLGIATSAVLASGNASGPSVATIPYSAIIYDADGAAWTFTRLSPRTYMRASITIAGIVGDTVTLTKSPAVGTAVVTIGAAELVGVEAGISGEE